MPDPNREELRIALVMNGGVSLAVWIGGLTHEVNRFVRREGAYSDLLDLLQAEPRVDVISGTSAGGINGALLALALVRKQSLSMLQDLWVEKAGLNMLLRDPLDPLPTSLLRGDDYFLQELKRAFQQLNRGGDLASPAAVPIDLTLTTTMLTGEPVELADDFGRAISDVNHAGRFRFVRSVDEDEDVFERHDIADRLALASRSTASFPVAFEPSFVPVNAERPVPDRPDFNTQVSFGTSRFVIDGGVLDNKPLAPAIDAIARQRIEGDVRRVLMYVVPDPGESGSAQADTIEVAPSARQVAMASLLRIPRVEPVAAEIRGIRSRNRRVLEERESRAMLTNRLLASDIQQLSRTLFPMYRDRRTQPAISGIVSLLADGLAGLAAAARKATVNAEASTARPLWLERQTHRAWLAKAFASTTLPWVPQIYPEAPKVDELPPPELESKTWGWGIRAVQHAASTMLDVLRRTQRLVALNDPARATLVNVWKRAYDIMAQLRRVRRNDDAYWRSTAKSLAEVLSNLNRQPADQGARGPELRDWVNTRLEEWKQRRVDPRTSRAPSAGAEQITVPESMGRLASQIAALLQENASMVSSIAEAAKQSPIDGDREAGQELERLIVYLVPAGTVKPGEVLLRLAWLEVVQYALGSSTDSPDQYVELIQVSGNTPSPFGGRDRASDKLAGIQLGHFGAFYKRSWRANDWMYGRLDGTANLVQVILDPDRLRRLALHWPRDAGQTRAEQARERIRRIAVDGAGAESGRLLDDRWSAADILRELAYLDDLSVPAPDALPLCIDAVSRRLQLSVLQEALITVANAVEVDEQEQGGASVQGEGTRLLRAVKQCTKDAANGLQPADALRIFSTYDVAKERITHEVGSDVFSMTTAQALAVVSSVGYRDGADLGAVKQLFRIVRAVTLAFYLMVRNVTHRSRTGAAVNGAALAAGVTIVGLTLFGVREMPAAVASVGWVLLGGGVLLALFRSKTAVVFVLALGILVWLARAPIVHAVPALAADRLGAPAAIVAFTGLLLLLGSIRRPSWFARWRSTRR